MRDQIGGVLHRQPDISAADFLSREPPLVDGNW